MTRLSILLYLLILSGCSIFQPDKSTIIQPKLLKQTALPAVTKSNLSDRYEFFCEMIISENGNVDYAKILKGSGDPIWDSLASISLLSWKFSPAMIADKPVKLSLRRKFIVMFEKPKYISLAEIQLQDITLADSVYKVLIDGKDFSELALKYSLSTTRNKKGFLGNVDINHYSKEISGILGKLNEGEFTEPLNYGDKFIIFKRLFY